MLLTMQEVKNKCIPSKLTKMLINKTNILKRNKPNKNTNLQTGNPTHLPDPTHLTILPSEPIVQLTTNTLIKRISLYNSLEKTPTLLSTVINVKSSWDATTHI